MGLHFMNEVPFRDVYLHALVRDKHGKKMSKSTGNVIDPIDTVEKYGTDAFRFTLTAFAAQGREIRMDEERIEGYRHFINKLWNAARFTQMHIRDCDPGIARVADEPAKLALPHRWILSRTDTTVRGVRQGLDGYNFNEVASGLYQFIWHEFCDWYLEWIKADLFGADGTARDQARGVLLRVLETVLRLLHPVAPFVTEEIWSVLPGERKTIMTEPFPEARDSWHDPEAEAAMELVMGVISGIRTIRSEADVHPTAAIEATLLCGDGRKRNQIEQFAPSIRSMTRAETLHILESGLVPDDAGHVLVQDIEVFVPLKGLINAADELAKLDREQGKLEQELRRVEGKLNNEKFMGKAPEDVIEKERRKLAELQVRLDKNAESSSRMKKLL
jgi:valyl-tRNA synthetase